MISLFRFISVCLVSILFIGCEMFKPKDTDGLRNIIPTAERDRAPRNPRDVSTVADAVPKYEPRTAAGNKSPYKVKATQNKPRPAAHRPRTRLPLVLHPLQSQPLSQRRFCRQGRFQAMRRQAAYSVSYRLARHGRWRLKKASNSTYQAN